MNTTTHHTTSSDTAAPSDRRINWLLILGLGVLALIRPVFSIAGFSDALGKPATPIILTMAISLVWILSVGLTRVARPVVTLVLAGVVYAVLAIALSGILSPLLSGELQGPLQNPAAVVSVLITNVAWGAITGLIALSLRRFRGQRY